MQYKNKQQGEKREQKKRNWEESSKQEINVSMLQA